VGKKTFIARTQVVQSFFTIRRSEEAILRAPTITHRPDITCPAITGKSLQFGLPECSLLRTLEQLDQWSFLDVPKVMFSVNEVVTGKEISVVFDDWNITAGRPEDTQRMVLIKGRSGSFLEYLHFDPPDIMAYPLVEDSAEKRTPGFSRHGAAAYAAFDIRVRLDQRQKGYVLGIDLFEKSVDLGRVPDVMCIHHT
jgi:hypothetical protein